MILGIIGILLSLALLITLAYRGVPVLIAAPIASIVALVFSQAPLLPAYTEIFMPAMAGFIGNFFPVFLTGAIFGMLMTVTGYAKSIATSVTSLIGGQGCDRRHRGHLGPDDLRWHQSLCGCLRRVSPCP